MNERELKLIEDVTILFLDGIISFHERDELLMRIQNRIDLRKSKEAKQNE